MIKKVIYQSTTALSQPYGPDLKMHTRVVRVKYFKPLYLLFHWPFKHANHTQVCQMFASNIYFLKSHNEVDMYQNIQGTYKGLMKPGDFMLVCVVVICNSVYPLKGLK